MYFKVFRFPLVDAVNLIIEGRASCVSADNDVTSDPFVVWREASGRIVLKDDKNVLYVCVDANLGKRQWYWRKAR